MKLTYGFGLATLAGLALAGCGSGSSTTASTTTGSSTTTTTTTSTPKKKDYKITMIAKSSSNPVFLSAQTGAEAAAKDRGKADGVNITIDWRTPNDEDGQVQAQRIAQAVNEGADAILISCSDAAKVTGAINDAVDKNVPVMTFDSDAPQSKRFAFYGADDAEAGKEVMDELAKAENGAQFNYAILAGNQNAPNLQKRVQGAKDAAQAYPNAHLIDVVNHAETPQDASAAVLREMNAHPEINAWAMIGGWPLFNTALLSLDPSKVKIVSVDALPAELAYVDKGIAPVLLAQPVYDWGYKSVNIVMDKLEGKPVQEVNKMELIKVTKSNLGQWANQLKKWGFNDVDPKYLSMK